MNDLLVQAAEYDGGYKTGRLCSSWHNESTQLLYHRNNFLLFGIDVGYWNFYFWALPFFVSSIHNLLN